MQLKSTCGPRAMQSRLFIKLATHYLSNLSKGRTIIFLPGEGGSHFGKPAHNFFSHSAVSNNFFFSFYSCEQFL